MAEPASKASRWAGARRHFQLSNQTRAAVARPSAIVRGRACASVNVLVRWAVPGRPSSAGNCEKPINNATPFMKPASTGCGTKRAKRPRPATPSRTCSKPIRTTQLAVTVTSASWPWPEPISSAGSWASWATRPARISAVAELGPPAGAAALPSRPYTRPPAITLAKAAAMPMCTAAAPSGAYASRPSVRTMANAARALAAPAKKV